MTRSRPPSRSHGTSGDATPERKTEIPQQEEVSTDSERLVLVDEQDQVIGSASKLECHLDEGVLHRAFSIFLLNQAGDVLLQRRSRRKLLWPGYWSNACCSHPYVEETVEAAVHRRLKQELGVRSALGFLYKFIYKARYEDIGAEYELCWVWLGVVDSSEIRPNWHEVDDWRFVGQAELDDDVRNNPDDFTPWMILEWQRLRSDFRHVLG